MATEIIATLSRTYLGKRRSVRYKLDVPLRVILQKSGRNSDQGWTWHRP